EVPDSALIPYTTLFRSRRCADTARLTHQARSPRTAWRESFVHRIEQRYSWLLLLILSCHYEPRVHWPVYPGQESTTAVGATYAKDRKSTRLNSSHVKIS